MSSEIGQIILITLLVIIGSVLLMFVLNFLSYRILKGRIVRRQKWGLNICCGKTDGGGVNVDIVKHADVPNYISVTDIYHLPFADKQFDTVLCSHTIEHVDDPQRFFEELSRVGKQVTLIIPPLWDISAAFNLLEHKHIFLTFTKEHNVLPAFVPLPFANTIHRLLGQRIHA